VDVLGDELRVSARGRVRGAPEHDPKCFQWKMQNPVIAIDGQNLWVKSNGGNWCIAPNCLGDKRRQLYFPGNHAPDMPLRHLSEGDLERYCYCGIYGADAHVASFIINKFHDGILPNVEVDRRGMFALKSSSDSNRSVVLGEDGAWRLCCHGAQGDLLMASVNAQPAIDGSVRTLLDIQHMLRSDDMQPSSFQLCRHVNIVKGYQLVFVTLSAVSAAHTPAMVLTSYLQDRWEQCVCNNWRVQVKPGVIQMLCDVAANKSLTCIVDETAGDESVFRICNTGETTPLLRVLLQEKRGVQRLFFAVNPPPPPIISMPLQDGVKLAPFLLLADGKENTLFILQFASDCWPPLRVTYILHPGQSSDNAATPWQMCVYMRHGCAVHSMRVTLDENDLRDHRVFGACESSTLGGLKSLDDEKEVGAVIKRDFALYLTSRVVLRFSHARGHMTVNICGDDIQEPCWEWRLRYRVACPISSCVGSQRCSSLLSSDSRANFLPNSLCYIERWNRFEGDWGYYQYGEKISWDTKERDMCLSAVEWWRQDCHEDRTVIGSILFPEKTSEEILVYCVFYEVCGADCRRIRAAGALIWDELCDVLFMRRALVSQLDAINAMYQRGEKISEEQMILWPGEVVLDQVERPVFQSVLPGRVLMFRAPEGQVIYLGANSVVGQDFEVGVGQVERICLRLERSGVVETIKDLLHFPTV